MVEFQYTAGVTTSGNAGSEGAYTEIIVDQNLNNLFYYCSNHSGMGSNFLINDLSEEIQAGATATYSATYLIEQNAAKYRKNYKLSHCCCIIIRVTMLMYLMYLIIQLPLNQMTATIEMNYYSRLSLYL